MSFPALRVAPRVEYTAEVIVLITTLGVNRREYLDSKRVCSRIIFCPKLQDTGGLGAFAGNDAQMLLFCC